MVVIIRNWYSSKENKKGRLLTDPFVFFCEKTIRSFYYYAELLSVFQYLPVKAADDQL